MILTEDEAKKKWCPEVRTGLTAGMAVNHHVGGVYGNKHAGDVHDETRCIASGCMMWRWKGWNSDKYPSIYEAQKKDAGPDPIRYGFCGKAGRP